MKIPWKINEQKKIFHEIPGGISRNIHGIFLDLELRKLSYGTFYSGRTLKSSVVFLGRGWERDWDGDAEGMVTR